MSDAAPELAPGVPPDYYHSMAAAEQSHWWYRGMQLIAAALLGTRLQEKERVLDAGCGTGGFLHFLLDEGRFSAAAGVDVATAAIDLARTRLPSTDLRVAPLKSLPFDDASFDLVVTTDVVQHIDESELEASMRELRRVLAPDGWLLVRTNGVRKHITDRPDWRAFDRRSLAATLRLGSFECTRLTHANMLLSLVAAARGWRPHSPTDTEHGMPAESGRMKSTVGLALLRAEAGYLRSERRSLPYGHTLFALASPRS